MNPELYNILPYGNLFGGTSDPILNLCIANVLLDWTSALARKWLKMSPCAND